MKRKRAPFLFHDLILDMQQVIRTACPPSTRSMLAMTCRVERATARPEDRELLLFHLAFEGDEYDHLKQCIKANPVFGQRPDSSMPSHFYWQHRHDAHRIVHEVLRGGFPMLLLDLDTLPGFPTARCKECVSLAVATNHWSIIKKVTRGVSGIQLLCYAIVTSEAIRHNNVPLLQRLMEKEWIPYNFKLDLPREILVKALDWLDVIRFIFANEVAWSEKCIMTLVKALVCSMIDRGWTMEAMRAFFAYENKPFTGAGLDSLIDFHASYLFDCALASGNESVLTWIWSNLCALNRHEEVRALEHCFTTLLAATNMDKTLRRKLFSPAILQGLELTEAQTAQIEGE